MKFYKKSQDVFTSFDFNKFYAGYFIRPNEKGKQVFYLIPCSTITDSLVGGEKYVRIIDAESNIGNYWYMQIKNIDDWISNVSTINTTVREFDTAKERYEWVAANL